MVRAKKVTNAGKQAEVQAMLDKLKLKCLFLLLYAFLYENFLVKKDKQDLEDAKRRFSTSYVLEILKEVESSVPQVDFIFNTKLEKI